MGRTKGALVTTAKRKKNREKLSTLNYLFLFSTETGELEQNIEIQFRFKTFHYTTSLNGNDKVFGLH